MSVKKIIIFGESSIIFRTCGSKLVPSNQCCFLLGTWEQGNHTLSLRELGTAFLHTSGTNFAKKKYFRRKFEFFSNFIEHFSKIFAKMIETFVFEPHFRMAYQNFELEIERKCGNLNSVSVLAHSKVLNQLFLYFFKI